MAPQPHNHGKAQVKVSTGSGNSLEIAGYTRNGADVSEEGFWIDVPGDENGGDAGDPIDIQYIGEMARVRLELTKFDVAVINKIQTRINNPSTPKTRGTIATPGIFMFANALTYRVLINTPTDPQNFVRCIPRAPTQRNMGVRFTMVVLEFDCYKNDAGVLYNSDTTG